MYILLTDKLTNKLIAINTTEILSVSSDESGAIIALEDGNIEHVKENVHIVDRLIDA